ncbi:hypothetical protein ACOMHN_011926 [Nucella lapillus]
MEGALLGAGLCALLSPVALAQGGLGGGEGGGGRGEDLLSITATALLSRDTRTPTTNTHYLDSTISHFLPELDHGGDGGGGGGGWVEEEEEERHFNAVGTDSVGAGGSGGGLGVGGVGVGGWVVGGCQSNLSAVWGLTGPVCSTRFTSFPLFVLVTAVLAIITLCTILGNALVLWALYR